MKMVKNINVLQTGLQIIAAASIICKPVCKLLLPGRGLANSSADGYPPGLRLALRACWMLLPNWQLKSACRPGCGWGADSISMPRA
jgi:hypothetical protein